MPSLEQIIRPFVVDPTTPPVPYITTNNEPEPEPVQLSIGIGGTRVRNLPSTSEPTGPIEQTIEQKQTSSSYSVSISFYFDEHVTEQRE